MGLVVDIRVGLVVASLLCSLLYAVILLTPVFARPPGLWTYVLSRPVSLASINLIVSSSPISSVLARTFSHISSSTIPLTKAWRIILSE